MLRPIASLLLGASVAEAVLWDGGYAPAPRVVFVVLASAGLAACFADDRRACVAAARSPAIVALAVLGVLGLVSVSWTVGGTGDTLRWGFVTLGYFAVAVCAGALVGGAGSAAQAGEVAFRLALGVAALAVVSGAVGLVATAAATGPYADQIGGRWRPGGTLEYAPALALLQVSALPVFAALLWREPPGWRSWRRVAGGLGAGVAVVVVVLSGSRLELALGAVVVLASVPLTAWRLRARARAAAVGMVALAVVAAVVLVSPAGTGSGRRDGGVTHGRIALWRAGVETFADRPLAGAGADAFLVASVRHQRDGPTVFAHDLPLELAVELGIAGLLAALALYVASVVALRQSRAPTRALFAPAVLAFLVASLVDWPWHLAGSGAVFALTLGAVVEPVRTSVDSI